MKGKGSIRNFSSIVLWVVETDTGPALAHCLFPKMKSPPKIDADGFKRKDGITINNHMAWWKVRGHTTTDIYDSQKTLKVIGSFVKQVSEKEFGEVRYIDGAGWGVPIQQITQVTTNKKGKITKYYIPEIGWISKKDAITRAAHGLIDNVVLVFPRGKKRPYLRALPDHRWENNLDYLS